MKKEFKRNDKVWFLCAVLLIAILTGCSIGLNPSVISWYRSTCGSGKETPESVESIQTESSETREDTEFIKVIDENSEVIEEERPEFMSQNGLGSVLPYPSTGYVQRSEFDDCAFYDVAETNQNDFDSYVDKLLECGFTSENVRYEDYFFAYDESGELQVTVNYHAETATEKEYYSISLSKTLEDPEVSVTE